MLEKSPILVAESLEVVTDPLVPFLRPRGKAAVPAVLAAMTGALARPQDPRPLPAWLLEHQRPLVRQLIPMLAQHGGALLAAPVGSGKTYMGLAAAGLWSGAPALALVPAILIPQWRRTATSVGVEIALWSHERLSRGNLPEQLQRPHRDRGLVIIDESHHFRNPAALRYRHLAPALVGRSVLLLSATPVVNRLVDLAYQLLLGVRDDALSGLGIPSLHEHLTRVAEADSAIGTLLLTAPQSGTRPRRHDQRARFSPDTPSFESLCTAIDSLVLSRNDATANLIRIVLWRALASSPAALAGVLRRYHGLLLHATEALGSGRTMDRTALRRFIANAPDQLLLWELLPSTSDATDLELTDREPIEKLLNQVSSHATMADEKCLRLNNHLGDGGRTIVFTGARETVGYLRKHLRSAPVAWCTGEAAGIGHTRMPRDLVLQWFGPGVQNGHGPKVLITTDVAAEGLDLQRAQRIVHYDLPWTSVRLDQREGRAIRLGSEHDQVEVVRFDPPAILAERLRLVPILARKRALPKRAGLIGATSRAWQWRDRMASLNHERGIAGCWAMVGAEMTGAIAGFTIASSEQENPAAAIGWLDSQGAWSEHPDVVGRILTRVKGATEMVDPDPTMLDAVLRSLSPIVRARLDAVRRAYWSGSAIDSATTGLIDRLNRLASRAARERDSLGLALLERGLRFAARGHTAGERACIQKLVELSDSRLLEQLKQCPAPRPEPLPQARLTGLIVFAAPV